MGEREASNKIGKMQFGGFLAWFSTIFRREVDNGGVGGGRVVREVQVEGGSFKQYASSAI